MRQQTDKVIRPTDWHSGTRGERSEGPLQGRAPGALLNDKKTITEVHQPTSLETKALLAGHVCVACRHFMYKEGQERLIGQWGAEEMKQDRKVGNVFSAAATPPKSFADCAVFPSMLVHQFAGSNCKAFQPRDHAAKSLWNKAKDFINYVRGEGIE